MKTNRQHHSNQTGGILPIVMVILIAFSLMIVALLQLGRNGAQEAEYQFNDAQAFSLAEAGLEQFKAIVTSNSTSISTSIAAARYWSNNVPNAGSFRVAVSNDPDWDNTSWIVKKYIVTSTGTARNGAVQSISIKARLQTFGNYLWATHSEGNVWFQTGDRLTGPVYTDDQLKINGSPVFSNLVESAASSVSYANSGSSNVFKGGLTLGVPMLDWRNVQKQVDDLALDPEATTLTGNYDITFITSGADTKAIIRNRTSGSTTTNAISTGKIFYVTGDAYVKGTVGTRVTVATPKSIYITDDIVYKSASPPSIPSANPATWAANFKPALTEALGLYSKTQVQIDSQTGTDKTVNIHAAILVASGTLGFNAKDKQVSHSGSWYINFYGCMGQYTRGVVGQIGGDGYYKNYNYDSRLGETPPPGKVYSGYTFSEWKQL